jgi:hypothetical protein
MSTPVFTEPDDSGSRQYGGLTLDIGGAERLNITNFEGVLPAQPSVKDRSGFVKAGLAAPSCHLDEDALHAIARGITTPELARSMVREGLMTTEVVGPAKLMTIPVKVFLDELFPLVQPRAGGVAVEVPAPRVSGLTDDGEVQAMVTLTFDDMDHLRRFMRQSILQTIALGRNYGPSILANKVARAVLVHVVRLEFADGSASFDVLAVRDGITRTVHSWASQIGKATPDEIATRMTNALLATKKASGSALRQTATADHARGRAVHHNALRAEFAKGMSGATPSEAAIRIEQTFTLPAQVAIGIQSTATNPVPPEQQFDDAIQAIIASIHSDFMPWAQSATDASVIQRALPRAVHDKALDAKAARMAVGQLDVADVPDVFGEKVPATALWRAVFLICWLGNGSEFYSIKKHLRSLLGKTRIEDKQYVSHLMPLVDLPWRAAKSDTERQTVRAWRNGGPVPEGVLDGNWDPIPTTDFAELVPIALADESLQQRRNARLTLQVAGGVALVTDKLLLSNVGSALTAGQVPFRADVDDIVTGLGQNETGLWLLAHAANAFRPDRRAVSSFSTAELTSDPNAIASSGAYVVPQPDPDDPSRLALDSAGRPVQLIQYEVVRASNPARAAKAKDARDQNEERRAEEAASTDADHAALLRSTIQLTLNSTQTSITRLLELSKKNTAVGYPFGTPDQWNSLYRTASTIQSLIFMNESFEASAEDDADEADQ